MTKILLADDHAIFRQGIKLLLGEESDMKVIAEAKNSREVIDQIKKKKFDIILLDITMPGKSGIDIIKEIKRIDPDTHVLILTMHPEDTYAFRAYKSGASGYITKDNSVSQLVKVIRKIMVDGEYVSLQYAKKLASGYYKDEKAPLYNKLSSREFQVFKMISEGKKVTEIMKIVSLSKSTINTYRARLLKKLELRSNVDLAHYAIDHDLI